MASVFYEALKLLYFSKYRKILRKISEQVYKETGKANKTEVCHIKASQIFKDLSLSYTRTSVCTFITSLLSVDCDCAGALSSKEPQYAG